MTQDALALSMRLFDLRAPKSLTDAQRRKIVVSFAVGLAGNALPVSYLTDNVWRFDSYITSENLAESQRKINWRIRVSDGCLTDPKYEVLLANAQDFIWSLFADPVEGRDRPTHSTLVAKVTAMKPLLRWMLKKGITRFRDLAGHTMDYLPAARKNERRVGVAADDTVLARLAILEQLYHQREKLNDALQRHPWPHESSFTLAGIRETGALRKNKIQALPDAIADEVGTKALAYVQQHADRILEQFKNVTLVGEDAWNEITGRDLTEKTKRKVKAKFRSEAAREAGFEGTHALNSEMIRLRTACYIVIDLFSGIRDSELMSIGGDCIAHRRSKDDTMDTIWLHGTIYKNGERVHAWQVSESVELAVEVITSLTAPLRARLRAELAELEGIIPLSIAKGGIKQLARYQKVKRQQDKLFLAVSAAKCNQVAVISGASMSVNLKTFCVDLGVHGEDGEPLFLKSSDFRPTYARMVARSEMGDLLTLRDHLGHRSVSTTIGYCGNAADSYEADTELMQMIVVAKQDRQQEIMGDILTSEKPLANGRHFLSAWRDVVRTAKNKEELIAQFSGALTLNGTGHSWCVGAVGSKSCGGFCVLEAKMCPDCYYGIITAEHRPIWEGIREQQQEALALGDLGIPGIARAKEILDVALKVLNRLDGKPDAVPIRFIHYGEIGQPRVAAQLTVVAESPAKKRTKA